MKREKWQGGSVSNTLEASHRCILLCSWFAVFAAHGRHGYYPLFAKFADVHTVDQFAVGNGFAEGAFVQTPKCVRGLFFDVYIDFFSCKLVVSNHALYSSKVIVPSWHCLRWSAASFAQALNSASSI